MSTPNFKWELINAGVVILLAVVSVFLSLILIGIIQYYAGCYFNKEYPGWLIMLVAGIAWGDMFKGLTDMWLRYLKNNTRASKR